MLTSRAPLPFVTGVMRSVFGAVRKPRRARYSRNAACNNRCQRRRDVVLTIVCLQTGFQVVGYRYRGTPHSFALAASAYLGVSLLRVITSIQFIVLTYSKRNGSASSAFGQKPGFCDRYLQTIS
jgi:hypothetical protein